MADSRNTHLVKTCHICGDAGFWEKIVTCFRCKITQEHVYCMRVLLLTIPEIWICEICQSSEDKESQQSFTEEHSPKILTPYNSELVHGDTMQSMAVGKLPDNSRRLVHVQKEFTPEIGKGNSFAGEEAINVSSRTQKVEKSSPSRQGPTSSQSIIMSTRNDIGFKTPPLNLSQQMIKMSPNIGLKGQSKSSGHCSADHKACQMEDKKIPLEYQDKHVKEEPVEILLPAKRVETSSPTSSVTIKFTPSPSIDVQSIICSGSLDVNVNCKSLSVQEGDIPNNLPKLEKYFPHDPSSKVAWCGSLEIAYSVSTSEFFDGFRVHFPGRIHPKAFECSKQMPGVLLCTMFPSSSLEVFHNEYPNVDDIALYFFPGNFERSRLQYNRLLGILEMKDLVLRSPLSGVELLVFPSKSLHVDFQGLEPFLWGVYRPMKSNIAVPPLLSCNATPQTQSCFDVQTKFKQLSNEVTVEQLNNSAAPPGYPRRAAAGKEKSYI